MNLNGTQINAKREHARRAGVAWYVAVKRLHRSRPYKVWPTKVLDSRKRHQLRRGERKTMTLLRLSNSFLLFGIRSLQCPIRVIFALAEPTNYPARVSDEDLSGTTEMIVGDTHVRTSTNIDQRQQTIKDDQRSAITTINNEEKLISREDQQSNADCNRQYYDHRWNEHQPNISRFH